MEFRPLCQELRSKIKYQNKRCSWHPYCLGNYKGFRSSGQELGIKTKIGISSYITILHCNQEGVQGCANPRGDGEGSQAAVS